jgi:hypothetical protein
MPGLIPLRPRNAALVHDEDICIVNADESDLTITIVGTAGPDGLKHVTDVLVSSVVCKTSRYLQLIIDRSDDQTEITLGGELKRTSGNEHRQDAGENLEGLLVMLAHLHGLTEQRMQELGLYTISILSVWCAIAYTERSQPESAKSKLKDWFFEWYAINMEGIDLDISSARGLAFPCQLFHHVAAYARVTKWLAYNHVGAVKDIPPRGFKRQPGVHLQIGDFVGMSTPIAHIAAVTNNQTGPVNHARGGLKTTLHKSLYKKCGHLLRNGTDDCNCWDATVGQYFFALTKIDVFPVDDVSGYSSIAQITKRLGKFKYDYMPECRRCRGMDWETVVLKAKANTEGYFDGLCLDCMDRSRTPSKFTDSEYWDENKCVGRKFDTKCSINHNQPSWYVSWQGRADVREKIMRGQDIYAQEA